MNIIPYPPSRSHNISVMSTGMASSQKRRRVENVDTAVVEPWLAILGNPASAADSEAVVAALNAVHSFVLDSASRVGQLAVCSAPGVGETLSTHLRAADLRVKESACRLVCVLYVTTTSVTGTGMCRVRHHDLFKLCFVFGFRIQVGRV